MSDNPQPSAVIFGNRRDALIAKCSDDRPLWTCSVVIEQQYSEELFGLAKTEKQFTDAVLNRVIFDVHKLSERERSQAMAEELKETEESK